LMSAATCNTSSYRSRSYRFCVNARPVRAIAARLSLHRASCVPRSANFCRFQSGDLNMKKIQKVVDSAIVDVRFSIKLKV